MRWINKALYVYLGLVLVTFSGFSQEEESSELYLEEYTDEFQELFFEALKQKGIENYDKAINLFLECKQMDPDNAVIDHELAKVYLSEKNYVPALESAIPALNSAPGNFWYLHTLVEILRAQGRVASEVRDRIPYEDDKLSKNLALIYYKQRNYEEALGVLKEMKESGFSLELTSKIRDSLEQIKNATSQKQIEQQPVEEDPLTEYKRRLELLNNEQAFEILEEEASEALELFPTQPYFYYMLGKAMIMNNKTAQAVEVMESALDFLLDDTELNNQLYSELAKAYRVLGNSTKANMYLSKVKDGS